MSFPIRSQSEINLIINRGQLTIGDLGLDLVREEKQGLDSTNKSHRDKMYRLILLDIYFESILQDDGTLNKYYLDPLYEKQLNLMLDAIVKLSGIYAGPAIPFLSTINIPLLFISQGGGSAPVPSLSFLTEFDNTDVDSPSETVDSFTATNGNFAMWAYSVKGSNPGEGSRSGLVIAIWQNSTIGWAEPFQSPDVVGITSPIAFSVTLTAGVVALLATTSTNNWKVRGLRLNLNS